MYSATIDLVAECQKWLRNVAYVKTDGQTGGGGGGGHCNISRPHGAGGR